MQDNVKLSRVKALAGRMKGDPRSVFYGDVTVEIDPADAAEAIAGQAPATDVATVAISNDEPSDAVAAQKVAAYQAMPDSERTRRTLLPPLACWNAMVIINPMLGRVLASALDYMLTKALNDYPFEGCTIQASIPQGSNVGTVTIDSSTIGIPSGATGAGRFIAVPFFRFAIASSTLNAAPGSIVQIDLAGKDASGASINTALSPKYTYSFQRLNNVEAVLGVYIPTTVVATRTLPFLPLAGDSGNASAADAKTITITFTGVRDTDSITVVVPGYASAELKEIATMYNLPAGLVR